jgi:hypothetical protein
VYQLANAFAVKSTKGGENKSKAGREHSHLVRQSDGLVLWRGCGAGAGCIKGGSAQILPNARHAGEGTEKRNEVAGTMAIIEGADIRPWPEDLAIQNDEAYTRLLLCPPAAPETKHQAAAIEKLAEKLIEREPHSLPHRTFLALALLRQERAEDALRVYSQLQVKQDVVSGSALAVHAAILAATANLENAKTEAAQLKRDQLLPEE